MHINAMVEILEKNSDKGKDRLKPVNLHLDIVELGLLQTRVPGLNISGFVRDAIKQALIEIEEQESMEIGQVMGRGSGSSNGKTKTK